MRESERGVYQDRKRLGVRKMFAPRMRKFECAAGKMCVCVCVCVRERERERERKKERES